MSNRKVNRWSTKEDILEDLAEVTGRLADVDERYIVDGDQPPPVRRGEDEDDEFNLRYSRGVEPHDMQPENMAPDLDGISRFLRMVEEHDKTPENGVTRSPNKNKDNILIVSKLNPNVPDFVPKSAIESSPRNNKSFNVNGDSSTNGEKDKEKVDKKTSENNNNIRIDKKLDLSEMDADIIKEMSIKLRNKISNVSKKEDLRTKKEKNVAIAALLKLHTAPLRTEAEQERQESIKLITPDYFATCPAKKEVRCEVHDLIIESESTDDASSKKDDTDLEKSTKNLETSSLEDDTSTTGTTSPKSYIESPAEMTNFPHDPNVQKSIKKVTSWLSKPESPKPKGPVVCLGKISFKKKELKSSISDDNSSMSNSSLNVASTTPQIRHFVPSKRAEDLSKKYSEQAKARERRSEDIWTTAMREMKEKEKKKKLEQSSQSDSRDDTSLSSMS